MRTGVEIYKCDLCSEVHQVPFPIAETNEEYVLEFSRLIPPFVEYENGHCRKMVRCGIKGCEKENGEPLLAKDIILKVVR